jgi:16S rRNA (guanine527-N7)-methyltransferase
MPTLVERFSDALRDNAGRFDLQLTDSKIASLIGYYLLLLKWNAALHLVAPCTPEEFATRHILESLLLTHHLPANACIADVGSGAGLPLIPCLLVRRDLHVTLIESSKKKAVFLRQALRSANAEKFASVIAERFENIAAPAVEFITCRALDRFQQILPALIAWAPPDCTLLLFAGAALRKHIESKFPGAETKQIPGSNRRFLIKFRLRP